MQQVRFTRPARMLDVYSERVSAGDTAWLCGKRPRVHTARNLKATLYVWCEAAPTSDACSGLNMFVHLTPPPARRRQQAGGTLNLNLLI